MMINSILAGTFLFSLLLSSVTQARTFYNTEGKGIEAELMSVENNTAVMKLANGRVAKVPITNTAKDLKPKSSVKVKARSKPAKWSTPSSAK